MSVMVWFSWGSWACSRPEGSFSPGGWSVVGPQSGGGVCVWQAVGVVSEFQLLLLGPFLYKEKVQLKLSEVPLNHDSPVLIYIDCYTDSVWVFYLFDLEFPTITDPLFLYRGVVGT